MRTIVIPLILICFLVGCDKQNGKTSSILKRINSLSVSRDYELMDSLLTTINPHSLKKDSEKAFYYLLKAQSDVALGRKIENDSFISFSVNYYERMQDKRNMARAYYYKGVSYYTLGRIEDAILFLKKAENMDKKVETPWLRSLIYGNLSYLNTISGANHTALQYAQKALSYSIKHNNVSWQCFAYNCIATSYDGMKMQDSAFAYVQKIIPYIDKINDKKERAGYLNNIGYVYYEKGLYKEAEAFFEKAKTILPVPTIYINLSKTYYMLGKNNKADSLVILINRDANFEEKAEMCQFLAERAERKGDYEAASRLYRQAKAMQDSANIQRQTEETVTMQREYEHKEYAKGVKSKETAGIVMAVLAVAVLAGTGVSFHRKTLNRAKRTIAEADRKIKEHTDRIAALERQDSRHAREAKELERKIRRLKDEQAAVINSGKALYDGIVAGGTTATWKKKDFDEFIEYYRTRRPEAVAEAEEGYSRLSSTHIFYLMLADMGVAGDDMRRILCLTDGALRTMRSRIKSRKKSVS